MRTATCVLGLLLGATLAPTTTAVAPAELRTLFPHEAQVTVERRLSRLVLPPEVLRDCRPDLSDLRLFDGEGRETPFLVDVGVLDVEGAELTERFDAAVIEATRREIDRDTGPALRRETYEIAVPSATPQTGRWTLVLDVPHAEFVARVRVESVNGIATEDALLDGSVFRLRQAPRAEKLRLPLPAFSANRLRVALESEHRTWLDPRFHLESARVFERGGRIAVPLEIVSTRHDDGKTVITLVRPRGIVPNLLRIDTLTGTFDRKIEIRDEGSGRGSGVLGRGSVFRVETLVPVGEREIRLRQATGDRLRVEIEDGDSPPLASPRFEAIVSQPSLIFSLPNARPAVLRFGGGRAHRPRYDLAGLMPAGRATGERARAAAALYDRDALGIANLAAIRPNPYFDRAPALEFAMRPGAELDRRMFSHLRRVTVPRAPEGLSIVELLPEDLALLRADLGDLRVINSDARQWPYLVEPAAVDRSVALVIDGPLEKNGSSHYALQPTVAPLAIDQLVLDADAPYFDRAFRLLGLFHDGEERQLAGGRLVRPIDDPRPVTIDVDAAGLASLELIVRDGDDAALSLRTIDARVRTPRIYLTAPEGEYDLLLGAPDLTRPQYELERVRDVVLAVQAAKTDPGELGRNPDYSFGARLHGRGTGQRVLLWAALILAVAVLAILTLRLARR